MSWIKPQFSKTLIDKAGNTLAFNEQWVNTEYSEFDVIANWRSSHGYVLNNYQNSLRAIVKKFGGHYLLAQRLKRIPSIISKLQIRKGIRLTQLQDMAGCRVVLNDIESVRNVVSRIRNGRLKKKIIEKLSDDYIENPKLDGYRCVHLVLKYDKSPDENPYNGQKVEIQIRSKLQHAWATALESIDLFTKYKLKSGKGPDNWQRFFALVGSAFAISEKCKVVPNTPLDYNELINEIKSLYVSLDVEHNLAKYKSIISSIEKLPIKGTRSTIGYIIVKLNISENKLSMDYYRKDNYDKANKAYLLAEFKAFENGVEEVALVATERIDELRKAYPNYYLDTDYFLLQLNELLNNNDASNESLHRTIN